MTVPVQVTVKDIDPSPGLGGRVDDKPRRLHRVEGDILRCRVGVAAPRRHGHQGRRHRICVEVVTPRGDIVVTRQNRQNPADGNACVAEGDASDAVARQLGDDFRGLRGQVKHHESLLLHGRAARIIGDDYGFIETSDGPEVHSQRNRVSEGGFDRLRVGDGGRLVAAEGGKDLQDGTLPSGGSRHVVA